MQDTAGWTPTLLTAIAALAAVLGALILAARGARAAGVGLRAGKRMAMQEILALDGKRRLVLLRCDGRDLLVLTGGAQDLVIGWLGDATPGPAREPGRTS